MISALLLPSYPAGYDHDRNNDTTEELHTTGTRGQSQSFRTSLTPSRPRGPLSRHRDVGPFGFLLYRSGLPRVLSQPRALVRSVTQGRQREPEQFENPGTDLLLRVLIDAPLACSSTR
jgi:hypothetical protein